MKLSVLLFASYADAFGTDRVLVELPDASPVSELVARLRDTPGGDRLPARPLVAVNRRYARYEHALAANDEVAVIPPVAGG